MSEFNYKQRPWSREISREEYDRMFSSPADTPLADSPRSTAHLSQPRSEGQPIGVGSGLPAPLELASTKPLEFPATRYAIEFARPRPSSVMQASASTAIFAADIFTGIM
jgi:hypothetical protein